MNKIYEEYLPAIEAAENKMAEIQKEMELNNKKIDDFNAEVDLLKKKHDFEGLNKRTSSLNGEKKFELERLISAKLMIIFEYINEFVHQKCFKNEEKAFNVLRDKFGIYENDYDYGFDAFFYEVKRQFEYDGTLTDIIENDDFPTICGVDDYELADETYFRGDLDTKFEIQIPQRLVDDLDDFIEKIKSLMLEVENSYEEKIREEEQKAKDERRKVYEELKKEFEGEE